MNHSDHFTGPSRPAICLTEVICQASSQEAQTFQFLCLWCDGDQTAASRTPSRCSNHYATLVVNQTFLGSPLGLELWSGPNSRAKVKKAGSITPPWQPRPTQDGIHSTAVTSIRVSNHMWEPSIILQIRILAVQIT